MEKRASYASLQVCHLLGYDYRHQHEVIATYALRNDIFHSINIWVESCSWGKLANHIYFDLKEMAPTLNDDRYRYFQKSLINVRDVYLVVKLPDHLSSWVPTSGRPGVDRQQNSNSQEKGGKSNEEQGTSYSRSRCDDRRQPKTKKKGEGRLSGIECGSGDYVELRTATNLIPMRS